VVSLIAERIDWQRHLHDTVEVSQLFDSLEFEGVSQYWSVVTSATSLFSSTNYDLTTSYVFLSTVLAGEDSLL